MDRPKSVSITRANTDAREEIKRKKRLQTRRKRVVRFYTTGIFLLLLIGGVFWGLHHERFTISEVKVVGNQTVSAQVVMEIASRHLQKSYWWLIPKSTALTYPKQAIIKDILETSGYVESLDFKVNNWQELIIEVKERSAAYIWCATGVEQSCFLADSSGYLFSTAPTFSDNIMFIINSSLPASPLGTRPLEIASFQRLVLAIEAMPEILRTAKLSRVEVSEVEILPLGDYAFHIVERGPTSRDQWQFKWNDQQDLSVVATYLAAVWSAADFIDQKGQAGAKLEYIDLRFGKKIFYKFTDQFSYRPGPADTETGDELVATSSASSL